MGFYRCRTAKIDKRTGKRNSTGQRISMPRVAREIDHRIEFKM